MRCALLDRDNVVQHVVIVGEGYAPPDDYSVVPTDTANIGDSWDGEKFARPTPALSKEALESHARRARDHVLAEGFVFEGTRVRLTDDNRRLLEDAAWAAREHPGLSVSWRDGDVCLLLSAKQILRLRSRIAQHAILCHEIMESITSRVRSGDVTSAEQIEECVHAALRSEDDSRGQ